jgi:hypothetical protein
VSDRPLVTAVVLNYNGAHLLPDCLSTLAGQDWPALEVLVVDNGSLDDSEAVSRAHHARWLPLGANLGFSRANNLGAAEAKGEWLFVVNNDMRFTPECVSRLGRVLAGDDTLFAVDPTQLDWDGTRVIHGQTRLQPGTFRDTVIPPFAVASTGQAAGPVEVPWGCAGSLLVRRDRFEALGGFDPTFFIDFEDTDLCWRAWRRGWRTLYVPDAVLHHKVGMSGDEHRHLVRGAARDRLPRFWFRRRVSYHTNLMRFALKCLPRATALRLLGHLSVRAAWYAARGHRKLALAIGLALGRNLVRLADTRAARRAVERTQVLDHGAVLGRFAPPATGAGP